MMSTKEELEKLTVAQLKEKLKSRKMATSGAKTDLINRLYESIMTEEKLLEEGPGGETIDLSSVNMDEVLGVLDDEKDTHSAASSDLADKSTSEQQMKQSDGIFSLSLGSDEGKTILQQQSPNKNTVPTSQSGSSIALNNQNNSPNKEDVEKKQQLPMDEAKKVQLKTAARLGVPLAGNTVGGGGDSARKPITHSAGQNEEELKAKRATRFGILAETTRRKSATEEDDKMLKRAERFGLPLKRGADGGASNSADEALQKRAKRFGTMIGGGANGGGEQDEKKAARAKRFGSTLAT